MAVTVNSPVVWNVL